MIKIKIKHSDDTGIYERDVNGTKYKFHLLTKTTRTTTLTKHLDKSLLYGRIKWYEDPIHNFSNGDLVEIKTLDSKTIQCSGVDCKDPSWNGVTQRVFKKDIQFMKLIVDEKETQGVHK